MGSSKTHWDRSGAAVNNTVELGAGKLTYNVNGNLPLLDLMDQLVECVKNNGINYTISILNGAK